MIKKETIEKIREIIKRHHRYVSLTMLGQGQVPKEMLAELKQAGFDTEHAKSFLEVAYNHNFINPPQASNVPQTYKEMLAQQTPKTVPSIPAADASRDFLNANLAQLIEKQQADVVTRIEALLHNENHGIRFGAAIEPGRISGWLSENSKSKLKTMFRDISKDAARNWNRVVDTELSNAISLGSVDRIVEQTKETPADQIYVYRIVKNDAALCKYCRKFYLDKDGTPVVYTLAHLLSNGTNYGKKASEWLPVATATHPNERCSQVIELKPGWRVTPSGAQTFMGMDEWPAYIAKKLRT